jgi:hypothetical protein
MILVKRGHIGLLPDPNQADVQPRLHAHMCLETFTEDCLGSAEGSEEFGRARIVLSWIPKQVFQALKQRRFLLAERRIRFRSAPLQTFDQHFQQFLFQRQRCATIKGRGRKVLCDLYRGAAKTNQRPQGPAGREPTPQILWNAESRPRQDPPAHGQRIGREA